jgi:hypothetical protein
MIIRIILTLFSFFTGYFTATFIFMYTLPIPEVITNNSMWVSALIGAVLAFFIWKITDGIVPQAQKKMFVGGIIGGGVGWLFTTLGAIIIYPDCNLCPITGVFLGAPIGFLIGLFGGWLLWKKVTKK